MKEPAENKKKSRRTLVSLYGKMAALVVSEEGISVHLVSTLLLVLSMWFCAGATYAAAFFLNSLPLTVILVFLGAAGGFLLVAKYYVGKRDAFFPYDDIVSLMATPPDFTINTADNKMYSVRMLPKKQRKVLMDILDATRGNNRFRIEKMGSYYKFLPIDPPDMPVS